jgi:hypothetical protein
LLLLLTQYSVQSAGISRLGRSSRCPPSYQEGAIVLGTGGDNSNWSVGTFFEGVMTAGYPTDAAGYRRAGWPRFLLFLRQAGPFG